MCQVVLNRFYGLFYRLNGWVGERGNIGLCALIEGRATQSFNGGDKVFRLVYRAV